MTSEQLLSLAAESNRSGLTSIQSGVVVDIHPNGVALVDFAANNSGLPVAARTCVPVGRLERQCSILLAFLDNDPAQPVIVGVLQPAAAAHSAEPRQVTRISAEDQLVLECGEASIVLTRSGKIQIRGGYIVSEARGVNQINGAAIKLN